MMKRSLLALILFGACGGDGSSKEPDASVTPDVAPDASDPTAVPRIQPASCRFTVSASLGLTQGTGYTCGDLVVYENRATKGRTIKVHFIKFESGTASKNATIYLDGGPGGDGQGIVQY